MNKVLGCFSGYSFIDKFNFEKYKKILNVSEALNQLFARNNVIFDMKNDDGIIDVIHWLKINNPYF